MNHSAYTACGGVVFVQESNPITLERAEAIRAVHLHNVAHWLGRADLSPAARTNIAKIEQDLADEMASAIQQASLAVSERRAA